MIRKITHHIRQKFYDSHPDLPLDPDTDQPRNVRPVHADWAHIALVGAGGFFGTLARYQLEQWLPSAKDGWPAAIFIVNVSGAFLLGLLLQALVRQGSDTGRRRNVRLLFGTGFLGAFTTYSSLAGGVVILAQSGHMGVAAAYGIGSVVAGITACALGILAASRAQGQGDER
jgi:CrcB protein